MTGFRETLHEYHRAARRANELRRVLVTRYGWDERKQMEEMQRVLTKQPLLPPRPPLGQWGRPARKGSFF